MAECPVEAIYAEGDVPAGNTRRTLLSTQEQSHQIKDSGAAAIVKKKDPLPTAEARKKGTRGTGVLPDRHGGCGATQARLLAKKLPGPPSPRPSPI